MSSIPMQAGQALRALKSTLATVWPGTTWLGLSRCKPPTG